MADEMFKQYRRSAIAEMADWHEGFDMERVSVSAPDAEAGSPKDGDKIARNPKNHGDRWLVAAAYFADNFIPRPLDFLAEGKEWVFDSEGCYVCSSCWDDEMRTLWPRATPEDGDPMYCESCGGCSWLDPEESRDAR